jgi:hypothetical protein
MILSCCCAPATVGHDAAAPPRTQRDRRLLMPVPQVCVIVTARMSALVGLKQASRPKYEMSADVRFASKADFSDMTAVGGKRSFLSATFSMVRETWIQRSFRCRPHSPLQDWPIFASIVSHSPRAA